MTLAELISELTRMAGASPELLDSRVEVFDHFDKYSLEVVDAVGVATFGEQSCAQIQVTFT